MRNNQLGFTISLAMTDRVFQLSGSCNSYPWGKKGCQSLAALLHAKTDKNFNIKDDEHYSELWFGDYPDFPARVLVTGETLRDVLCKNKELLLGKKVIEQLDGQLPYLPKILSIAKALPLQIHPNKDLAAKLHQNDPKSFTDPNHKPEIAVALSKFEVFAGFKPLAQISPLFNLPALRPFVPDDTTAWTDDTLRQVIRSLLKAPESDIHAIIGSLRTTPRETLSELIDGSYIHDLLPRLEDQYGPHDAGILVALTCMNFLVLEPGQAIYIPADGIHAYLSGDIVECMARSNNVLNSGFCPPADRNNVDLFTEALTFSEEVHSVEGVILDSGVSEKSRRGKTVVYQPPMSEFDSLKTSLKGGEEDVISPSEGPGVFIVTAGKGRMVADGMDFELSEGFIFFVAPGVEVMFTTDTELEIHMAVV